MQPADIAIALRRRSPWEAMDLGLSMLQRWWRLVVLPHVIVAALMFAAAAFVEAFWSPLTEVPFNLKIAVGIAGWALLLAYFALAGRGRAAG